jgi:hypothetical protein
MTPARLMLLFAGMNASMNYQQDSKGAREGFAGPDGLTPVWLHPREWGTEKVRKSPTGNNDQPWHGEEGSSPHPQLGGVP